MADDFPDVRMCLLATRLEMRLVSWDPRDQLIMVERFVDD
jgi:hypothetical protein